MYPYLVGGVSVKQSSIVSTLKGWLIYLEILKFLGLKIFIFFFSKTQQKQGKKYKAIYDWDYCHQTITGMKK